MAARQPRLDRHQFEQALGVGEGQGSLACFSPWGRRESGMTEQLNSNKKRQRRDKRYLNSKLTSKQLPLLPDQAEILTLLISKTHTHSKAHDSWIEESKVPWDSADAAIQEQIKPCKYIKVL